MWHQGRQSTFLRCVRPETSLLSIYHGGALPDDKRLRAFVCRSFDYSSSKRLCYLHSERSPALNSSTLWTHYNLSTSNTSYRLTTGDPLSYTADSETDFSSVTLDWPGETYIFSVRVRNLKGWSEWSDETGEIEPTVSSFTAKVRIAYRPWLPDVREHCIHSKGLRCLQEVLCVRHANSGHKSSYE
jgi:hypothetical protein